MDGVMPSLPHEAQGGGGESAEDKAKLSRWQIGSNSLGVLEQTYLADPFPGAHCEGDGGPVPARAAARMLRARERAK